MQSFIESHAIYAIIVLGVLEAMCIPWSSEVTFLIGGAVASGGLAAATQHPSLAEVIILGTLAEVVGSYVAYYVGRKGGKPLVRRWGRYVLITESDVARAERFLVGRGVWAVPVARIMPFIRSFSSIVVGLVDVPPVRFGILNLIGTFIYVIVVSSIGYSLGSEWSKFDHVFSKVSYVIAAVVVVALVYFVVHRVREFKREAAALSSQEPAPGQPRNPSSYDQLRGQQSQDQQYGQRPQNQQYGQQQNNGQQYGQQQNTGQQHGQYGQPPRNQQQYGGRQQDQQYGQPRNQSYGSYGQPRGDDPRYRTER